MPNKAKSTKRIARKGGPSRTSPPMIQSVERSQQAVEFRLQGYTYEEIGQAMGITSVGAYSAVVRGLDRMETSLAHDLDKLRQKEVERCDVMLDALMQLLAERGGELVQDAAEHKNSHDKGVTQQSKRLVRRPGIGPVIDRIIKVQERKARFLGLDRQQQIAEDPNEAGTLEAWEQGGRLSLAVADALLARYQEGVIDISSVPLVHELLPKKVKGE